MRTKSSSLFTAGSCNFLMWWVEEKNVYFHVLLLTGKCVSNFVYSMTSSLKTLKLCIKVLCQTHVWLEFLQTIFGRAEHLKGQCHVIKLTKSVISRKPLAWTYGDWCKKNCLCMHSNNFNLNILCQRTYRSCLCVWYLASQYVKKHAECIYTNLDIFLSIPVFFGNV